MNNLEALIIVRGSARVSGQMRTRQGIAAGKVIDKKIQSLLRKKAWRDGTPGTMPVHMGDEEFRYQIPDDPITAALKELLAAHRGYIDEGDQTAAERLQKAATRADEALAGLENTPRQTPTR